MLSSAIRGRALILGGIAVLGLVVLGYLIGSGFEGFRGPRANAGTGVRRVPRRMDADDHPRTAPLPVRVTCL